MQLRPLAPGDIPAAVALSRACRETPAEQVGNPAWLTEQDFYEETALWDVPPGERFVVAEAADGTLAGFAGVETAGGESVLLHGPIVAPAHRGHGLGKALLRAALETAARLGARTVEQTVGDQNERGQALLGAAGFTPGDPPAGMVLMNIWPEELRRPAPVTGAECELAGPAEVRGILAIYQQCFPRDRASEGTVRAWCASPYARVFTIRQDGRLAGFARLELRVPALRHVSIAPAYRERGLGAYLGAHALQEGWRLLGPRPIGTAVQADRADALRLCERLGFRRPLHLRFFSRAVRVPAGTDAGRLN